MADDAEAVTEQQENTGSDAARAASRAAFIAGLEESTEVAAGKAASKAASKPAPVKAPPADDVDDELDEQIDDDDDDADAIEADAADDDEDADTDDDDASDADEDPDADLDDDAKSKPDAELAKRLDQVRRTDRRLREQRERQFSEREREIATREEQLRSGRERIDQFEKLADRVRYEPEAVLMALGATEEDLDHAVKRLYAFTKTGKADPKVRDAVDRLTKEREKDEQLRSVQKRLDDQESEKKTAAQNAEGERVLAAYVAKVTKLASGDKTPLTKQFFAADPQSARDEFEAVTGALAQKLGKIPDHKTALVEFEKHQRRVLRRYGIDPKSLGGTKTETTTTEKKPATTTKPVEKKPNGKPANGTTQKQMSSREMFARGILE